MTKTFHVVPPAARAPAARFDRVAGFVGLSREDWGAIEESAGLISPYLPSLTDGLYQRLLADEETRQVFLGPEGELDSAYMAMRKEHLTEWVQRVVDGANDPSGFAEYLAETGRRHTSDGGDARRVVAPRHMLTLTSLIQTAMASALSRALPEEPVRAARIAQAWNKVLMVQLELFLAVIVPGWE